MSVLPSTSWVMTSPRTALPPPSAAIPVPHGRPGPHVGPPGVHRHDGRGPALRAGVALGDGVVDRVGRAGAELVPAGPEELPVDAAGAVGRPARGGDVRAVALYPAHPLPRAHGEYAAVPQVSAGGQVPARDLLAGLLGEGIHDQRSAPGGRARRAGADVAVAGRGPGRPHPEGHQPPLPRQGTALGDRARELPAVRDVVVGGHRDEDGVLAPLLRPQGGEGERRRGVPPGGLKDQRRGGDADGGELLCHEVAVLLVADDQRGLGGAEAQGRLLEHGGPPEQGEELLGEVLAGERPQPGPRPARQDDRPQHRFPSMQAELYQPRWRTHGRRGGPRAGPGCILRGWREGDGQTGASGSRTIPASRRGT